MVEHIPLKVTPTYGLCALFVLSPSPLAQNLYWMEGDKIKSFDWFFFIYITLAYAFFISDLNIQAFCFTFQPAVSAVWAEVPTCSRHQTRVKNSTSVFLTKPTSFRTVVLEPFSIKSQGVVRWKMTMTAMLVSTETRPLLPVYWCVGPATVQMNDS